MFSPKKLFSSKCSPLKKCSSQSVLLRYHHGENTSTHCGGYSDFKLHKYDNPLQHTTFFSVLQWKIRLVKLSTLTWNCTNSLSHYKTRHSMRFTMGNHIYASVNSNFKLHKCGNLLQNTSFWVFCNEKTGLCKCQLWFTIAQMLYPIAKHVLFCVLQWEIRSI